MGIKKKILKKTTGCVHIVVKNGSIHKIISHLTGLPRYGVIHLSVDNVYSFKDFRQNHKNDCKELTYKSNCFFCELGNRSIQ